MLTHSAASGFPLGILVVTSESQSTIAAGLRLLQNILPEDAFHGRGQLGPKVVMTDDCKALRQALQDVYPHITGLLCVFHVLQAMWRWLWSTHHGASQMNSYGRILLAICIDLVIIMYLWWLDLLSCMTTLNVTSQVP